MGLGASGRLYVGVNLEFARLPLNNSVHAEQFLVVNALHHGEQAIEKMAVSAAPCGHCRQFYSELCCAVRILSFSSDGSDTPRLLEISVRTHWWVHLGGALAKNLTGLVRP